MVIPQITGLDIDTWTQIGSGGGMSKCYLTWDGDFKWGGATAKFRSMEMLRESFSLGKVQNLATTLLLSMIWKVLPAHLKSDTKALTTCTWACCLVA